MFFFVSENGSISSVDQNQCQSMILVRFRHMQVLRIAIVSTFGSTQISITEIRKQAPPSKFEQDVSLSPSFTPKAYSWEIAWRGLISTCFSYSGRDPLSVTQTVLRISFSKIYTYVATQKYNTVDIWVHRKFPISNIRGHVPQCKL